MVLRENGNCQKEAVHGHGDPGLNSTGLQSVPAHSDTCLEAWESGIAVSLWYLLLGRLWGSKASWASQAFLAPLHLEPAVHGERVSSLQALLRVQPIYGLWRWLRATWGSETLESAPLSQPPSSSPSGLVAPTLAPCWPHAVPCSYLALGRPAAITSFDTQAPLELSVSYVSFSSFFFIFIF